MNPIQSSRLRLEPFTHSLMLALITGPDVFCKQSGLSIAPDWPNEDFLEALPFIAAHTGKHPTLDEWSRLLVLPHPGGTGRPGLVVGEAGFKGLPDAGGQVEIGYGVSASHRGRGLATEAVVALCAWAFEHKAVTRIRAECLPDNEGSIRVLRRAGFTEANSDADMLRWTLTPSQFAAGRR